MYDMLKRLKYFRRMIISRYLLPGGYSLAPTQVAFLPTARCNLRCDMCAQWGSAGNLLAKRGSDLACDEMAFDKWQDIVDEIAFAKPLITIWGGEPLLYHDILRLISHVKARSLHCLVITNGILLEQYAADLVKSGLDKIEVSIDGPREINDGIRGQGAFGKAIEGIKAVLEARRKLASANPRVIINSVITEKTFRTLKDMAGVAQDLGADSVNFIYGWTIPAKMGEAYEKAMKELFGIDAASWKGFAKEGTGFDFGELALIIGRMQDLAAGPGTEITFLPDLRLFEIAPFYRGVPIVRECMSLWHRVDIRYNGDVVFCGDFPDYVMGNVKEDRLLTVWNSPKARAFRTAVKKAGTLPICSRCCNLYQYKFP